MEIAEFDPYAGCKLSFESQTITMPMKSKIRPFESDCPSAVVRTRQFLDNDPQRETRKYTQRQGSTSSATSTTYRCINHGMGLDH
eukprot:6213894-Pleurochrysis_carterae.AAC.1